MSPKAKLTGELSPLGKGTSGSNFWKGKLAVNATEPIEEAPQAVEVNAS
jgi:hypothetical protein